MPKEHFLLKVILWRIISVSITLIVTWLVTGNLSEATGLTVILHLILIVGHYLFEFAWGRLFEAQQKIPIKYKSMFVCLKILESTDQYPH